MEENKGGVKVSKVSIVIAHHKGRLIERCLNSIDKNKHQVIVVTTDDTLKKTENMNQLLTLSPVFNNPSFKRNKGAELCLGEYICFMDDDVELTPRCIEVMSEHLDNHPKTGMGSLLG